MDRSRRGLFDVKLPPVAQRAGALDLEGLVEMLRVDRTKRLQQAEAEAMTLHETSFFRDVKPFEVLRAKILPELIRQRRAERRLRLWCAASSTGQEAYSLAMLLRESFPELTDWDVEIVGTDLSQQVVAYAQTGRYRRLEVNRGLPVRMLVKYFARDGEEWVIEEGLRGMCRFEHLNLRSPLPKPEMFDLVLLRNVLLYFSEKDRSLVFTEVFRTMALGGYLLLGNGEQAEDSTDLFQVEFASGCYFYRPMRNPQ